MLGSKGITSSEASHIANFVKELVKAFDVNKDNFKVFTKSFTEDSKTLRLDSNEKIDNWGDKLLEKGKMYSLSAYLKEAIKYKEELYQQISEETLDSKTYEDKLESFTLELPVKPETSFSEYFIKHMTEDDRVKYLSSESICAHIGKFIHDFDDIRKQLDSMEPTSFQNISGLKVITVINTPLYEKEEILSELERLTSLHRNSEKIVNMYKANYENWKSSLLEKYETERIYYTNEHVKNFDKRRSTINVFEAEFQAKKLKRLSDNRALKIVIPESLSEIYNSVTERLNK